MHTLGWGRYKWRYAPAEAEGEREAGAGGEVEMGPSRSSRSSQHGGGDGGWFVAEVKVSILKRRKHQQVEKEVENIVKKILNMLKN